MVGMGGNAVGRVLTAPAPAGKTHSNEDKLGDLQSPLYGLFHAVADKTYIDVPFSTGRTCLNDSALDGLSIQPTTGALAGVPQKSWQIGIPARGARHLLQRHPQAV